MPFLGLRAWAGTVDEAKILQSQILGQVVSYSLYLPPGYRQHSRRYPVLYLLHGGADGQPADWFRMAGIDILLDRMIGDGLMPPCIAVAPDGRRPGGDPRATYFLDDADGSYGWRSMFLQEFIPQVEATHQAIGTMQMRPFWACRRPMSPWIRQGSCIASGSAKAAMTGSSGKAHSPRPWSMSAGSSRGSMGNRGLSPWTRPEAGPL